MCVTARFLQLHLGCYPSHLFDASELSLGCCSHREEILVTVGNGTASFLTVWENYFPCVPVKFVNRNIDMKLKSHALSNSMISCSYKLLSQDSPLGPLCGCFLIFLLSTIWLINLRTSNSLPVSRRVGISCCIHLWISRFWIYDVMVHRFSFPWNNSDHKNHKAYVSPHISTNLLLSHWSITFFLNLTTVPLSNWMLSVAFQYICR
jgi:hypothetical protein